LAYTNVDRLCAVFLYNIRLLIITMTERIMYSERHENITNNKTHNEW